MELLEWQKRTAPFTLALSLAYTFAFVYPIYWYPVSHTTKNVCEIFAYVIWGLFALDYLIQMKLAPDNKSISRRISLHSCSLRFHFFARYVRCVRWSSLPKLDTNLVKP